jgi:hypothetical protein
VNNELEGILQEVVVVCFEVLSKHLHEGAEEIIKTSVRVASCWDDI